MLCDSWNGNKRSVPVSHLHTWPNRRNYGYYFVWPMSEKTIQIDGGESVVCPINTQSAGLTTSFPSALLKFPFFTVSVEQWEDFNESHTSQVCNYIFTCWQNSSEKVTSCQVLCFQPRLLPQPPPLSTHLSSLSNSLTNGALLDSVWDLSGLVKVGCLSQR